MGSGLELALGNLPDAKEALREEKEKLRLREQRGRYRKKREARLKAEGRCIRCAAKEKSPRSTRLCEKCLDKAVAATKKVRTDRKEQGLCVECGEDDIALTSAWYCESCLARISKRDAVRRRKRRGF